MCGICGLVAVKGETSNLETLTRAMVRTIHHRGPDDSGVWTERGRVALGQARLSVIDLSPLGHQPMQSPSGEWIVTYNGEVYNFLEMRRELEAAGEKFRGSSDTEVITAALDAWGFERTRNRLRGMFALAAWQKSTRRLHLARDPLGQKPLFYGFVGDWFVFGSELRVLRLLDPPPEPSPDSAQLMLRYNCIPAPHTIYSGIWKLPPASSVVYSEDTARVSAPETYWSPPIGERRFEQPTFEGAIERLEESVRLRMVSDVPLGAFLSGGVDSSIITAVMQKISKEPVRSFTAGFEDPRYNEAGHAAQIAAYLGTDHTELRVTEKQAIDLVPQLGEIYDEPFADPSQVPTVLLSRLTRQHVTVALSGDGGDELFRGYNRSIWLPKLDRVFRWVPRPLRKTLAHALNCAPSQLLVNGLASAGLLKTRLVHDKLRKMAALLKADDFRARYRTLLSDWSTQQLQIPGALLDSVDEFQGVAKDLSIEDQLTLADYLFYLPNEVLAKVDRASMSTSLEVRSPLLDHHFVDYCAAFAHHQNVRGRQGKLLLQEMLERMIPKELFDRPKMGFAAPIRTWLRGPLREWAGDLLNTAWVREEKFLAKEPVLAAWRALQSGQSDTSHKLWNVLMLLSWLESESARRL